MSLGTKIYTWFKGNLVGSDELGNKYYLDIYIAFLNSSRAQYSLLLSIKSALLYQHEKLIKMLFLMDWY